MAELKTKPNDKCVKAFIASVDHKTRQQDASTLLALFEEITQEPAVMWGDSIIGFGSYKYSTTKDTYDWMLTGFSPRKQNMAVYVMQGFSSFEKELATLGKVKHSKSCLYLPPLSKIDIPALKDFLIKVVADMKKRYPK